MKIFLTGGAGYLGGRVAERLQRAGHDLRLMVRDVSAARKRLGDRYELIPGDLGRPGGLPAMLAGCDAVVHTAAVVRNWSRHPEEFERVNVAGSWALCEAALEARIGAFLYTSSFFALGPSPDGRPVDETALDRPQPARFFNDYHSTKFRAARLLRAFVSRGLPLVTVFPGVIFGPGAETDGNHVTRILRWLKDGRFPGLIGGGGQRWNMAFIDDVVEGHVLALERGKRGDTFILGGSDRVLREMMGEAAARLNVPTPTRVLPYWLCHWIASFEETKARYFGTAPLLTHGEVEIYRHDWIYSSDKARRLLGYRTTPFETAFDRTLEWIKGTRT